MQRIVLPTPFPVGPVNLWLLPGEPLTLVDAGPNTPEALAALERSLAEHGQRVEDVELLVLTHQHSDHIGLAGEINSRSGCAVAASGELGGYLADVQASLLAEETWEDELLRLHGATPERRTAFLAVARSRRAYGGSGAVVDRVLVDGDVLEAGGHRLRVIVRPGHSPTDTLFVDDASGTALVGDHLIDHISSNPLIHRPAAGPVDPARRSSALIGYLDGLGETADADFSILHTGHGADITGHRQLIAERIRFQQGRTDQVHQALAAGPHSAAELSEALWPAIAVNQTYLTLCEVLGALDLLERGGRVTQLQRDGGLVYRQA